MSCSNSCASNVRKNRLSSNICRIYSDIIYGYRSSESFVNKVGMNNVSLLVPKGFTKIYSNPGHQYEKLEHMSVMLPNPNQDKLLCLWSVKGIHMQRIQMLKINSVEKNGEDGRTNIDICPTGAVVLQSFSKISNVCWAPMYEDYQDCNILYTTTSFIGNSTSLAMLRKLDSSSVDEFRNTEFGLGSHATWTCRWDLHNKKFSVGSEKCALLLDVQTRRMWELFTNRSDVLAQTFSKQVINL